MGLAQGDGRIGRMTSANQTAAVEDRPVLDLRDYARVVGRHWLLITVAALTITGVAFLASSRQPRIYEATARVVVEPVGLDTEAQLNQLLYGGGMETQQELVTSAAVADQVAQEVGGDETVDELVGAVSSSVVGESQILEISATSDDPERAADLAQAFAETYLALRREDAVAEAETAFESLQSRATQVQDRLREITAEAEDASATEVERLDREESTLLTQIGVIQSQIAALPAPESFAAAGGDVIAPALEPTAPVSPRPMRTAVLALVFGSMLGMGLAFLREFLDQSIRGDSQVTQIAGRPVLGHIPVRAKSRAGDVGPVTVTAPASQVAEAYQTLRANVRFVGAAHELRTLLITSPHAGEGKTTTAANLAVVMARSGTRVLLVGLDLRRPTLFREFGRREGKGITAVLSGEADLSDVLLDVGVPNLQLLPAGAIPPNAADLISSPRMAELMLQLDDLADLVIYDSPPLLAVADSLEMAPRVSGVILVVDAKGTKRNALRTSVDRLTAVGSTLLGVVFNNVELSEPYSYYYQSEPDWSASARRTTPNQWLRPRRRTKETDDAPSARS